MPRGQKSKLRAREKRRQAREEHKPVTSAEAAEAKEDASSSSSLECKDAPQGSSAAETTSKQQKPERVPSTIMAAAVAAVCPRSNEGTNEQEEETTHASQAAAATEQMPGDLLERKIALLVHYLLYKYQVKESVTKVDMMRKIIQVPKNHFPDVLRRASGHLELLFGLEMKEVDPKKNIYVLVNKLELDSDGTVNQNRGVPVTGLLMTVLGVIFTNGNCATEEEVWEVLNMMGMYEGREHFIFGEPKKLLTVDLVRQKYLEYQQVPGSDPPRYHFLWGPRACAETSKMRVLEFLAKIHDTVPSAFSPWYEEAVKDEEERAQARAAARARPAAAASSHSKGTCASSSHSGPK